ncbi:MAG: Crp/Fnr family transcriptional regulator [Cytophagales bacterium]|jgi:CRP-like cAMP-binding protein|nr:Crp/Fnr family transcriptional regulator [Cytophagales bacterium]
MQPFAAFKNFLKNASFLTEDDCALFEPSLQLETIAKKEFFLEQGQTCRTIGFVNSGVFRVYYLSDGKEINTRFVFENDFVTDYDSFLHQKPSRYFIEAMEGAEIVTFDFEMLQHAYNQSKNWERFGRQIAEESYRITTRRVESFLFMNGEERYLEALRTEPHVFERIPLYQVSSYLGLERESLSRLRKKITQHDRL